MSLAGKTIGRYRIIEQLGQGGMAVVYKAYDTRLDREVAVKLIRADDIPKSQHNVFLKRFEIEAKAQAKFDHPNIVPIHDFGEHEGAPYLVMAYRPGGTLAQLTGTPVPYPQAAGLLAPIADALVYAHAQDVIHRDIKPSNIILDPTGKPALTDFGIAKLLGDVDGGTLTGTGMGIGTPQYMAPEQWRGKPEKATDIYALGVVFYELVTGRKPYDAETPAALAIIQATEPLPRPTDFISDLPEHVEQALYTALAPQPEDRYESMAAFEAVLKELSREQTENVPLAQTRVEELPVVPTQVEELAEPEAAEPAPVVPTFYPQEEPTMDALEPPAAPQPLEWADVQTAPKQKFTLPVWGWGLIGMILLAGIVFGVTQLGGGGTPVSEVATETGMETEALTIPIDNTPKILNIALTEEPDTLNPYFTSQWKSSILQELYLCRAWQYDDQNIAYPHLVTEIPSMENGGISEDGLTITVNLKENITWSDGEQITTADFIFTYEMIMAEENEITQYPYDRLAFLERVDNRTFVMHFDEPFPAWQATFWQGVLPKHILNPVFETKGNIQQADWNFLPSVGCGPYFVSEWIAGDSIRFEKNKNYWLGNSNIEVVNIQFFPNLESQTTAIAKGEIDLAIYSGMNSGLPYVPQLRDAGMQIFPVNVGYAEGWFFNMRDMASPAIQDLTVRQSIAMAIDREAIIEELLLGLTKPAETFWDPIAAEFASPEIEPWVYDPDRANRLLNEAGYLDRDGDGFREYPDGSSLVIIHGAPTREIRQNIQEIATNNLRDIGINLQTQAWDADIFFGSYTDNAPPATGEVDIMEWSDGSYFPDPDTDYWLCSNIPNEANPWGFNYFICDEELDSLLHQQQTVLNSLTRKQIFYQISEIVHDDVYWLGLFVDPDIWVLTPDLSGVKISGVTPFYNIMEWTINN